MNADLPGIRPRGGLHRDNMHPAVGWGVRELYIHLSKLDGAIIRNGKSRIVHDGKLVDIAAALMGVGIVVDPCDVCT